MLHFTDKKTGRECETLAQVHSVSNSNTDLLLNEGRLKCLRDTSLVFFHLLHSVSLPPAFIIQNIASIGDEKTANAQTIDPVDVREL